MIGMEGDLLQMFSNKTEKLGLPQWSPTDHPDFLTDINGAFKTIDSLGDLKGNQEDQATAIDNLTLQVTNLTQTAIDLKNEIDEINAVVTPEAIKEIQDDISSLTEKTDNLMDKEQLQDTNITEIASHMMLVDSSISNINNKLESYKELIDYNTVSINSNDEDIAALQTALGELQTSAESLTERISTVENTTSANVNSINTLSAAIAELTSNISEITQSITTLSATANTAIQSANTANELAQQAQTTANEAVNNAATNSNSISDLSAKVTSNTQSIADNKSIAEGIAATVAGLENRIAMAETDIESNMASIANTLDVATNANNTAVQATALANNNTNAINEVRNTAETAATNISSLTQRMTTAESNIQHSTNLANTAQSVADYASNLANNHQIQLTRQHNNTNGSGNADVKWLSGNVAAGPYPPVQYDWNLDIAGYPGIFAAGVLSLNVGEIPQQGYIDIVIKHENINISFNTTPWYKNIQVLAIANDLAARTTTIRLINNNPVSGALESIPSVQGIVAGYVYYQETTGISTQSEEESLDNIMYRELQERMRQNIIGKGDNIYE